MTNTTNQPDYPVKRADFEINIPAYVIFTIITCGLFNIYWNYRQMEACNYLLGRQEFDFGKWLLLTIITCGIYHIYYQYKMGSAIVEIQQKNGKPENTNLPVLSLVVTIVGLTIVADCVHQNEINMLVR
jgi:hypothetical protein